MSRIRLLSGYGELAHVASGEEDMLNRKQEIEDFARKTLAEHGLRTVPVNPVVVAQKLGIRLSHALFSEHKYSGLTASRNGHLTILVSEADSPLRKRFTVAHEIGHCLLHLSDELNEIIDTDIDFYRTQPDGKSAWTAERQREWEANVFAAELLMPRSTVKEYWMQIPAADRTVATLAKVFQVSEVAMGFRLSELGVLDNE